MQFTLAALATLASVAAANPFGLIAARSASPIHLREIEASGNRFYIGRKTSTYCPSNVAKLGGCPNKKGSEIDTLFVGGDGTLSMSVVVPGGQQVYVDPACGAVGYTVAHSAAKPEGAIVDGWTLTDGPEDQPFDYLSFEDGLLACPVNKQKGVYQIFAQVEGVKFSDACLGFNALAPQSEKTAGAWQYA